MLQEALAAALQGVGQDTSEALRALRSRLDIVRKVARLAIVLTIVNAITLAAVIALGVNAVGK